MSPMPFSSAILFPMALSNSGERNMVATYSLNSLILMGLPGQLADK